MTSHSALQETDYQKIFLSGVALMDTRAPVEFQNGSFPTATNLPLMLDDERAAVGTCYKQQGQQAAITLGHQLVSGDIKAQRVASWLDFTRRHPDGYLFCFRGGLRSQIVQQWLHEAGVDYPRIQGGYKAMRQFLIQTTETAIYNHDLLVMGGMTGCGKTELLAELPNAVDLEAHANHRGSGFGRHATRQPTQIGFESRLAVDLLHKQQQNWRQLVVEDENQTIGRCALPPCLRDRMKAAPVIWLEAPADERLERVLKDYVIDLRGEFIQLLGDAEGQQAFAEHLLDSLSRISKRLGGLRYQQLLKKMQQALMHDDFTASLDDHRAWIHQLLQEYYDPMYQHQYRQKTDQICFTGDSKAIQDYLLHLRSR